MNSKTSPPRSMNRSVNGCFKLLKIHRHPWHIGRDLCTWAKTAGCALSHLEPASTTWRSVLETGDVEEGLPRACPRAFVRCNFKMLLGVEPTQCYLILALRGLTKPAMPRTKVCSHYTVFFSVTLHVTV